MDMETNNEMISFETAFLAREKGFDVLVDAAYVMEWEKYLTKPGKLLDSVLANPKKYSIGHRDFSNDIVNFPNYASKCSKYVLQKWLREKKGLHIEITLYTPKYGWRIRRFSDDELVKSGYQEKEEDVFDDHDEAWEKGLYEALLLL